MLVPFRVRPMYSIGANAPNLGDWHVNFMQWSSFPSDTATYLFAIAAGLWIISRWLGLFFGVFAALVALARVFLGIHYPSDIFVGALIGIATSIAFNRETVRKRIAAPILTPGGALSPLFLRSVLSRALRAVGRVRDHTAHWLGHRAFLQWVPTDSEPLSHRASETDACCPLTASPNTRPSRTWRRRKRMWSGSHSMRTDRCSRSRSPAEVAFRPNSDGSSVSAYKRGLGGMCFLRQPIKNEVAQGCVLDCLTLRLRA